MQLRIAETFLGASVASVIEVRQLYFIRSYFFLFLPSAWKAPPTRFLSISRMFFCFLLESLIVVFPCLPSFRAAPLAAGGVSK